MQSIVPFPSVLRLHNLTMHVPTNVCTVGESRLQLSKSEACLLCLFAVEPDTLVSRERCYLTLYKDRARPREYVKTLDIFVHKLLKKLREKEYQGDCVSVHGRGYVFTKQLSRTQTLAGYCSFTQKKKDAASKLIINGQSSIEHFLNTHRALFATVEEVQEWVQDYAIRHTTS
jgi:DNA-binding winged helix-turn-helix (wHTH) protein